jgi:glycosyltransferase involved in cell wall biosynthesis
VKNDCYEFLYPSFARPYKNFELACEAAKKLWAENKKFKLFITIKGNENSYARMLKKKYGGLSYIVFTGLLKRDDLFKMYGRIDCLLFLSKLETWGMPITEFEIFNKPIIAVNLPYTFETLGNYNNCEFVDSEDPKELKKVMQFIIDENKFRRELSLENHSKEEQINSWRELVNKLI